MGITKIQHESDATLEPLQSFMPQKLDSNVKSLESKTLLSINTVAQFWIVLVLESSLEVTLSMTLSNVGVTYVCLMWLFVSLCIFWSVITIQLFVSFSNVTIFWNDSNAINFWFGLANGLSHLKCYSRSRLRLLWKVFDLGPRTSRFSKKIILIRLNELSKQISGAICAKHAMIQYKDRLVSK